MYAHITGLGFDYSTFNASVIQGTVSDPVNGDIRSVVVDKSDMDYNSVNKLWSEFAQPVL